jgi:predicted dehydrogenase
MTDSHWQDAASHLTDLSIGIVGAGQIAADSHIPAILLVPGAKITWIVDRDDQRARRVAKSFGISAVSMPRDLGQLPAADVVLLTVPYGVRAPYYEALSQAGAAVYVEKPFARTLEQHDRQCALFAPERLGLGLQRRCSGATWTLEDLVATETFGPLRRVDIELGKPGVSTAGRYSSDLSLAGGGFLFEVGVHLVDFVLFATRATEAKVTGGSMILERRFDVHTEAQIQLQTPLGNVDCGMLVTNLRHTSMEVAFHFETALARVNLFGDSRIRIKPKRGASEYMLSGEPTEYPLSSPQIFFEHWSLFLDGVRNHEANLTSARSSRLTSSVVEQLYQLGES